MLTFTVCGPADVYLWVALNWPFDPVVNESSNEPSLSQSIWTVHGLSGPGSVNAPRLYVFVWLVNATWLGGAAVNVGATFRTRGLTDCGLDDSPWSFPPTTENPLTGGVIGGFVTPSSGVRVNEKL